MTAPQKQKIWAGGLALSAEETDAGHYLEMAVMFRSQAEVTTDPMYAARLEEMAAHMMEIAVQLDAEVG